VCYMERFDLVCQIWFCVSLWRVLILYSRSDFVLPYGGFWLLYSRSEFVFSYGGFDTCIPDLGVLLLSRSECFLVIWVLPYKLICLLSWFEGFFYDWFPCDWFEGFLDLDYYCFLWGFTIHGKTVPQFSWQSSNPRGLLHEPKLHLSIHTEAYFYLWQVPILPWLRGKLRFVFLHSRNLFMFRNSFSCIQICLSLGLMCWSKIVLVNKI
jgi:hypothetical protein